MCMRKLLSALMHVSVYYYICMYKNYEKGEHAHNVASWYQWIDAWMTNLWCCATIERDEK